MKALACKTAAVALALLLWGLSALQAQACAYITGAGDTLAGVAERTGCTVELLALVNGLANDPDLPLEEERLLNLADSPVLSVTVRSEQTLAAAAAAWGADPAETATLNRLATEAELNSGDTLIVPLGEECSCVVGLGDCLVASAAPLLLEKATEGLRWPLQGEITSPFGRRSRGWHSGLDIAAASGTPIAAAAAGTVIEADWKNDAYGWAVMIDHGAGLVTLYGHCSRLVAEVGQQVSAGETVAEVGSTGNSTGPHLHFEVRQDGECEDPLEHLPEIPEI